MDRFKVIFVAALSLCLLSACAVRQTDVFYVEHAGAWTPEDHAKAKIALRENKPEYYPRKIGLTGHRITEGGGTVLALRTFRSPSLFQHSGRYEKTSIFLASRVDEIPLVVDMSDQKAGFGYWSEGGQSGGATCLGWVSAGQVRLTRLSETELEAHLKLKIITFSPLVIGNHPCGRSSINRKLTFVKKDVDLLSPWEGKPSDSVSEEGRR